MSSLRLGLKASIEHQQKMATSETNPTATSSAIATSTSTAAPRSMISNVQFKVKKKTNKKRKHEPRQKTTTTCPPLLEVGGDRTCKGITLFFELLPGGYLKLYQTHNTPFKFKENCDRMAKTIFIQTHQSQTGVIPQEADGLLCATLTDGTYRLTKTTQCRFIQELVNPAHFHHGWPIDEENYTPEYVWITSKGQDPHKYNAQDYLQSDIGEHSCVLLDQISGSTEYAVPPKLSIGKNKCGIDESGDEDENKSVIHSDEECDEEESDDESEHQGHSCSHNLWNRRKNVASDGAVCSSFAAPTIMDKEYERGQKKKKEYRNQEFVHYNGGKKRTRGKEQWKYPPRFRIKYRGEKNVLMNLTKNWPDIVKNAMRLSSDSSTTNDGTKKYYIRHPMNQSGGVVTFRELSVKDVQDIQKKMENKVFLNDDHFDKFIGLKGTEFVMEEIDPESMGKERIDFTCDGENIVVTFVVGDATNHLHELHPPDQLVKTAVAADRMGTKASRKVCENQGENYYGGNVRGFQASLNASCGPTEEEYMDDGTVRCRGRNRRRSSVPWALEFHSLTFELFTDAQRLAKHLNGFFYFGQNGGFMSLGDLGIFTINFSNTPHKDKDKHYHSFAEIWNELLDEVQKVLEEEKLNDKEYRQFLETTLKVQRAMTSSPTTCTWAYVKKESDVSGSYVESSPKSQYELFTHFLFPSSKKAIRYRNKNVINFRADQVEHCTSPAVVRNNLTGEVTILGFGMKEWDLQVIAWGSSPKKRWKRGGRLRKKKKRVNTNL